MVMPVPGPVYGLILQHIIPCETDGGVAMKNQTEYEARIEEN